MAKKNAIRKSLPIRSKCVSDDNEAQRKYAQPYGEWCWTALGDKAATYIRGVVESYSERDVFELMSSNSRSETWLISRTMVTGRIAFVVFFMNIIRRSITGQHR